MQSDFAVCCPQGDGLLDAVVDHEGNAGPIQQRQKAACQLQVILRRQILLPKLHESGATAQGGRHHLLQAVMTAIAVSQHQIDREVESLTCGHVSLAA